jgi:phage regulator Rha-like protein
MNDLIKIDQTETISSIEIAELTGKQHTHVMRAIEKTLTEAEVSASIFGGTYKDKQGKTRKCYNLPRFECDLVISGYSVRYRAAIIKRWHELEAGKAPKSRLELAKEQVRLIEREEKLMLELQEVKIELDEAQEWASVKRMEKMHDELYDWRVLKKVSQQLSIKRKDVFDQNYGTVKAYHADVWAAAYDVTIED